MLSIIKLIMMQLAILIVDHADNRLTMFMALPFVYAEIIEAIKKT